MTSCQLVCQQDSVTKSDATSPEPTAGLETGTLSCEAYNCSLFLVLLGLGCPLSAVSHLIYKLCEKKKDQAVLHRMDGIRSTSAPITEHIESHDDLPAVLHPETKKYAPVNTSENIPSEQTMQGMNETEMVEHVDENAADE